MADKFGRGTDYSLAVLLRNCYPYLTLIKDLEPMNNVLLYSLLMDIHS